MEGTLGGRCLCGGVQFHLHGTPITLYACHCLDCQRRTGSGFALSLVMRTEDVLVTTGEPLSYSAQLPDGRIKTGVMCGSCGTRLWGTPARNPRIRIVQPGILDDTSWIEPVAHIWMRSAQKWILLPPNVATFEEGANWESLVSLWRERGRGWVCQ